jgi:hypothetical protein
LKKGNRYNIYIYKKVYFFEGYFLYYFYLNFYKTFHKSIYFFVEIVCFILYNSDCLVLPTTFTKKYTF